MANRAFELVVLCAALPGFGSAQCEVAALTASDPAQADRLGMSVAIDGDTLLAGMPRDEAPGLPAGTNSGSARVFELVGGSWVETAALVGAATGPGDQLGAAVALGGGAAFLGAPEHDGAAEDCGAVHVFEPQGGTWVEVQVLEAGDAAPGQSFGRELALAGGVLVVGAQSDDGAGTNAGAFYVFEKAGTAWVETAKVEGPGPGGQFGNAVAYSADRVLVGAWNEDDGALDTGAAYVFARAGGTWSLDTKLAAAGIGMQDQLGWTVAFAGDVALVTTATGTIHAFEDLGAGWVETGAASAAGLGLAGLGQALAAEGGTILVGSPVGAGVASLLRFDAGAFAVDTVLAASTGEGSFGRAVALSGGRALVGAHLQDLPDATAAGAVFLFEGAPPAAYCTAKTASAGCVPAVAVAASPPRVVTATAVVNQKPGLLFYGLAGPAALPFQGGTLCVLPPLRRTPIQTSGGGPPPDDCSGSLAFDFTAWVASGADPALVAGARVDAQFWYRDPAHPDGTGVGLTDAAELTLCP